ncbi:MAG TPA: slipin family protein [Nautiliaceae bacterium]|nr:slipin family protein [Nautiliaceae bacterium]
MFIKVLIFFAVFLFLILGIKIVNQYERGIVLRLGKFNRVANPGLRFIIPIIENMIKVDLRTVAIDIRPQEVITKDNIPARINGIVYVKVIDPKKFVLNVDNPYYAVETYAQTILRDVLSKHELDEILTNRRELSEEIENLVNKRVFDWGLEVVDLKISDIEVDEKIKMAIARQAEAERERRAVIIKANGELEAAKKYIKASEILGKSRTAVYLRTLHFLSDISKDPNQKFIIIPLELLEWLKKDK